jgi:hypothetical protein
MALNSDYGMVLLLALAVSLMPRSAGSQQFK